jgi:hypothetical protein
MKIAQCDLPLSSSSSSSSSSFSQNVSSGISDKSPHDYDKLIASLASRTDHSDVLFRSGLLDWRRKYLLPRFPHASVRSPSSVVITRGFVDHLSPTTDPSAFLTCWSQFLSHPYLHASDAPVSIFTPLHSLEVLHKLAPTSCKLLRSAERWKEFEWSSASSSSASSSVSSSKPIRLVGHSDCSTSTLIKHLRETEQVDGPISFETGPHLSTPDLFDLSPTSSNPRPLLTSFLLSIYRGPVSREQLVYTPSSLSQSFIQRYYRRVGGLTTKADWDFHLYTRQDH